MPVRLYKPQFRRPALPGTSRRADLHAALPREAPELVEAAHATIEALLQRYGTATAGLSDGQADVIRQRVGFNEIGHEKPPSLLKRFWISYRNPFNLLLTTLAGISHATGDFQSAVVIGAMVALSTLLRFWQDGKSSRAAEALKAMVSNTATVKRSSAEPRELPVRLLVPGDIIVLSAGDMIPADCRILSAKDLFISQAAMTGESLPTEKFAELKTSDTTDILALDNIVFMGTNVVSGSASALVLAIGSKTCFGTLAAHTVTSTRAVTAFESGMSAVSWLLIRFIMVMTPFVFLINGVTKGNWVEALLFALSVAVGLTPEMLPMIVTSTLAKGAVFLSRRKVIVKHLDAIQNLGSMDVLCTDKTGTLTQDRIVLTRYLGALGGESIEVLAMAYLNSQNQTGLRNLLDVAVLEKAASFPSITAMQRPKIDEIPFDFVRRRMSVIVAAESGSHLIITKGAIEEVLSVCTSVREGEHITPLSASLLTDIRAFTSKLSDEGLRVVAVAVRETDASKHTYSVVDESGMTLVGYVAFLDPPKESAAPALQALAEHGISVKILTGDNDLVARKVCEQVAVIEHGILLGHEIEEMDDSSLSHSVECHNIFARLAPLHKERIVRALKANGHVVGFMGDGINDAPAIRAADVGISVDSAVDIAKEAADIILLEKSLMVIDDGVLEGRRVFFNMLKYIKMTASSNFGNVFSVLIASIILPFLPMLPIQILVQNLLYDFSQTAIPFDNVDMDLLKHPQRWQPANISRFMIFFGPISSIFDLVTFAMMWFVFGANSPAQQTLFQSGWFVVGLLTQTLIVHLIRTPLVPFLQSRPAPSLLAMTLLTAAIGIYLPMGVLAPEFKMESLPVRYFYYLPAIIFAYMTLVQAMKGFYRSKWGWQ